VEVLCGRDAELFGSENTAVTASKASLDLPQAAYAAGRGSLVQGLMRSGCTPRQGYAHAKGQRYLDTILLFEAMGGDSQSWVVFNASSQP
jgi:outer membrane protein TolC